MQIYAFRNPRWRPIATGFVYLSNGGAWSKKYSYSVNVNVIEKVRLRSESDGKTD